MKKLISTSLILASTLVVAACSKEANAAVDVLAGYQNNKVNDTEGLVVDVALRGPQVTVGATTQVDVSDGKIITYGAYAGVPYHIRNTQLTLTPFVGYDRYKYEQADLLNVGGKVDFAFDKRTNASFKIKASKDVNSNVDLDGLTYTFGVTRTF